MWGYLLCIFTSCISYLDISLELRTGKQKFYYKHIGSKTLVFGQDEYEYLQQTISSNECLSCQAGVRWRQLPFIDIVDIPNRYLDIVTDGERGPIIASLVPGPAMSVIAANR